MNMTVDQITKSIYKWGIYPALVLLREMQDNEQYEQCAIVKKALDYVVRGREWYFDTSVDDESLSETLEIILDKHFGRDIIEKNMPYYIDEFRKSLTINK